VSAHFARTAGRGKKIKSTLEKWVAEIGGSLRKIKTNKSIKSGKKIKGETDFLG